MGNRGELAAPRRWAVEMLLVTALVAAACGGDGGGTGVATTTVPPGPGLTTSSTTPGTDPVLVAKAKAATLQTADFTPGFEPQPEEPGQGLNIEQVWAELLACMGVKSTAPPAGVATSPTYLRGLATQGRSTVEYTSEPAAAALATALVGPKSSECFDKAFVADLDRSKPEGATPGVVTVARRELAPAGQRIMAWRINASVNLAELVVPLFQDFIVVFKPGTVVRMFFLNPGSEFPQDLQRSTLDKVVARA